MNIYVKTNNNNKKHDSETYKAIKCISKERNILSKQPNQSKGTRSNGKQDTNYNISNSYQLVDELKRMPGSRCILTEYIVNIDTHTQTHIHKYLSSNHLNTV